MNASRAPVAPLRLLVLGGTAFLGRWIVADALARGHEVTVFHRGLHGGGLFPQAQTILGDRSNDLSGLIGRSWDAVIDTCGHDPSEVEATARVLCDAVDHYAFVSRVDAYRAWPAQAIPDEDAPLRDDGAGGGFRKAACERVLERVLPGRTLHVRPAPLVGPDEYFGRLPWWLLRMARGGVVLAPGSPAASIQLVDARDVAAFMLDMVQRRVTGAFNVGSPPGACTWGELLEACRDVVGSRAELAWVDGERVAAMLPDPWELLPLWPAPIETVAGRYAVGVQRAFREGLRIRPLRQTVQDTWDLLRFDGLPEYLPQLRVGGLEARREAILLAALGARA